MKPDERQDLIAACRALLRAFQTDDDAGQDARAYLRWRDAIGMAEAAIHKAEAHAPDKIRQIAAMLRDEGSK